MFRSALKQQLFCFRPVAATSCSALRAAAPSGLLRHVTILIDGQKDRVDTELRQFAQRARLCGAEPYPNSKYVSLLSLHVVNDHVFYLLFKNLFFLIKTCREL